jgi:hypothetical protein
MSTGRGKALWERVALGLSQSSAFGGLWPRSSVLYARTRTVVERLLLKRYGSVRSDFTEARLVR